jgi:type II secretory pathway predicted ATPase ExeA
VPDEPLYEAFYGLREQPFALTTDPRFLFMSDAHRRAYEELLTGLRRREGLLVLTGDTGMGKTTVCRAVVEALGPRTFSALILNPYMSDAEVLRVILRDFGLVSRDEIRKGYFAKADVPQLLDTLEGFLQSLVPINSFAVVIIDEAQSLAPKVLDQIRVLGGMEAGGQRLLQIILVGQPALLTTLNSDAMAALQERVSRRSVLGPLPPAEVDAYVQHRLTVAGGRDTVEFTADAINTVAELTRGVPRRINLLCDRALEAGRLDGTNVITPALVERAWADRDAVRPAVAAPPAAAPPAPTPTSVAAPVRDLSDSDFEELSLDLDPDTAPDQETVAERELTFGQAPAKTGRARWAALVLAVLVGGAGLGTYLGWLYVTREVGVPGLPAAPDPTTGLVPGLGAPPAEAEERYLMQELERTSGWKRGG